MKAELQKVIAEIRILVRSFSESNGSPTYFRNWKSASIILFLALLCVTAAPRSFAQTYLQDLSPPPVDGAVPVELGSIDLAKGTLNLQIPLGTYPQRGGRSGNLALVYNSNLQYEYIYGQWYGAQSNSWAYSTPSDETGPFGGFGYGGMMVGGDCYYYDGAEPVDEPGYYEYTGVSFTAPDGSGHSFGTSIFFPYDPYNPTCNFTPYAYPSSGFDDQGTGYYFSIDAVSLVPTIYGPDGTLYVSSSGAKTDPNGNEYPLNGSVYPGTVDTISRAVPKITGATSYPGTQYWAVPTAENGISTSSSTYTLIWQAINIHTNFGVSGIAEYTGTTYGLSEVDLPDGTNYQFTYDSGTTPGHYGEMTGMKLPTGGWIYYGYTNTSDAYGHPYRALTQRTTPDSTTGWSYGTPVGSANNCGTNCTTETIKVTAPSGDSSVHTFADINSGMQPTETQYYDSASHLLGTTWACYSTGLWDAYHNYNANAACPAPYSTDVLFYKTADITTLQTVSGGTVISMKKYTYDCGDYTTGTCINYGNLTKLEEWNFGSSLSGSPDRITNISYYNSGHVVNKPATTTVTNSSGGLVAKTINTYDGYSLVTSGATGVVNHDDTNYGSSFTPRGNLTQVQQYTSSSAYTAKSMTYDITGQLRSLTDGNGNVTTYNYNDNFFNDAGDSSSPSPYYPSTPTNAYLTSEIQAYGTSAAETSTFGYYFGTGQMAEATDPNSQTTYSHFYDALSRPTSTKYPDGGWNYLVYPSGSETQVDKYTGIASSSLTTSCSTSGNACRHDQTLLDGLGRTTSQILVSDPSGADTVATIYDGNGRVLKTSNPYRSTSDPTYGWTWPSYDGLNRVVQTQDADSSNAYTYYGPSVSSHGGRSLPLCSGYGVGYPVLNVDEAGKLRQMWVDGFGRLIEVDEPDPSSGSLTSGFPTGTCYAYDLLNNLTSVSQSGSRTRTFTYDMASRLVCSANPELNIATCPSSPGSYTAGTIAYVYDNNGNVTSKQAPLENQTNTSNTVTTTYTYDALNRLTKKSFNDGITPTAYYDYDGSSQTGCSVTYSYGSYAKGHRTAMCDAAGTEAWSYDQMGRVATDQRTTNSVTKTTTYSTTSNPYNYDGSIAQMQFPSGNTFANTWNSAQQLVSTVDSTNSINYGTSAAYSPSGAIASLTQGSSLLSTSFYNSRLQPCRISVKNSGAVALSCADSSDIGNVMDLTFNFNLGSIDNGNVAGITNNRDTTRSQLFTYDSLNRINTAAASTYAASPAHCWGQSYAIDPFGNLTGMSGISSSYSGCTQASLSLITPSQNRLSTGTSPNFQYDVAGNMISDINHGYTFDAENHILQVDGTPGTCSTATDCYVYDGDGNRVEKKTSSPSELYWYGSNSAPMLETNGSGTLTKEYVFFGGNRIASRDSSSNVNYYVADHLGTARVVTNASGSILDDIDYEPYGVAHNYSVSSGNNYKFTGKERDTESGNDYFGARYYASSMGRFLSPDTMPGTPDDPQSWNLYNYVLNNPLKNIDPDGHDVQVCDNNGQCKTISNDAYKAAQQAQNQGGLNAPTLDQVGNSKDANGNFTAVGITSTDANGNTTTVGSAKYVAGDNPGIDPYVGNNMAGLQTLGAADKVVTVAGVAVGAEVGVMVAATAGTAAVATVGRWGLQRLAIGASSPALLNLINRLYQAQDEIPGGTAGAVRNEVMTGEYINGGHSIKAAEMITALQNLIKSGQLSGNDQTIAGHIISDLKNSLGR